MKEQNPAPLQKSHLRLGLTLIAVFLIHGFCYYCTPLIPKDSGLLDVTILSITYGSLLLGVLYLFAYFHRIIRNKIEDNSSLQTDPRHQKWIFRLIFAAAILTALGFCGKMMPYNERLFDTSNYLTITWKNLSDIFLVAGFVTFLLTVICGYLMRKNN